ncbi:alcohol dehydrogenase [Halorubrum alkaliphilum]|uniref:Alcohol dehydrogenase n=1 Tax=Halorubrum alkaliphilum TaxID=261290 RepID=A0A8T4GG65_9EURY|nr:iron-containing alcohol dehydrogenase family protein [Halorubrum alkaliphilum]MBP1923196.1 alcohol dehydrogenase [Halorubrum alkaliphilum]
MEQHSLSRFEYRAPTIRHGSVEELGRELANHGYERALVITGKTVGSRPAVLDPVREGLSDRLVGVVDRTTPEKRLETVLSAAERAEERDADVLVGLGGASSLDVTRVTAAVAASESSPAELRTSFERTGTLPVPEAPLPSVAVPTTLAGGSLSMLGGVSARRTTSGTELVGGGVGDPRLMPVLALYDPELVGTTPREILAGSAMNGFNKGVETLYSSHRTPVTDATASRGLRLLIDGLPTLSEDPEHWDLETMLRGVSLVQYGTTRPTGTTFSLLHALGHSLRVHAGVQLGVAHAVVTPPALERLFDDADGRRELLADAMTVDTDERGPAEGVVSAVASLRETLGLPERLRNVEGVSESMLETVARTAAEDFLRSNDPPTPSLAVPPEHRKDEPWCGTPHPPADLTVSTPAFLTILESAW